MRYREYKPHPPLDRFVKCYWIMDDPLGLAISEEERIAPDGCMELIIHYGDPFHDGSPNDVARVRPRCVLAGQITGCLTVRPSRRIGIIAARFHPFGARGIIRESMASLTGRMILGEAIWGRAAIDLEERLMMATSDRERLGVLDQFLRARVLKRAERDDDIRTAVSSLVQTSGRQTIDELSRLVGLSGRQLERRFAEFVGLSPKLFARIARFRRVFEAYEGRRLANWATVAVECGYFDQAHLSRDFREFAGQSPAAFVGEESWFCRSLRRGPTPADHVGFLQERPARTE